MRPWARAAGSSPAHSPRVPRGRRAVTRGRCAWALTTLLAAAACGEATPVDYPDPTALPSSEAVLTVDAPADYVSLGAPEAEVVVTAPWATEVTAAGQGAPVPLTSDGASFRGVVPLLHGTTTIAIRAHGAVQVSTVRRVTWAGATPGLVLASPPLDRPVGGVTIPVEGAASALAGSAAVRSRVDGGAWVELPVGPDGRFAGAVTSGGASPVTLVVEARDLAGTTRTLSRSVTLDLADPTIALLSPADGSVRLEDAPLVTVTGQAADASGIEQVLVGLDGDELLPAELSPTPGGVAFTAAVQLAAGRSRVVAVAVDRAGRQGRAEAVVLTPQRVVLTAPTDGPPPLFTLTVDREGLAELLPPERLDEIRVLCLDMADVVAAALAAIRDPAAHGMDLDAMPQAARNLQRVLTMGPDTADLGGTALDQVMAVTAALGIPPATVLAALVDIAPDAPFLPPDVVEAAVVRDLVETHPTLLADPCGPHSLTVTLGDALADMQTLGAKLGPVGDHPGLVSGTPRAAVMTDAFAMTLTAESHLRPRDGLDLGAGRSTVFLLDGPVALGFDFADPARFSVKGLADEPLVAMVFHMAEHAGLVGPSASIPASLDDSPKGTSPGWDLPPWTFEHLVLDASYEAFHALWAPTFATELVYGVGEAREAAVIGWDHGVVTVTTPGPPTTPVGDPPPPSFLWDLLLDVAQVRLHDGGLAEGAASVDITLEGVRVPLTAQQMEAELRASMGAQAALLSELLAGDRSDYAPPADVVLDRDGGTLVLRSVQGALAPGKAAAPGLCAEPTLTSCAPQVKPAQGQVFYLSDEGGGLFALTVESVTETQVGLRVAPIAPGDGP